MYICIYICNFKFHVFIMSDVIITSLICLKIVKYMKLKVVRKLLS